MFREFMIINNFSRPECLPAQLTVKSQTINMNLSMSSDVRGCLCCLPTCPTHPTILSQSSQPIHSQQPWHQQLRTDLTQVLQC